MSCFSHAPHFPGLFSPPKQLNRAPISHVQKCVLHSNSETQLNTTNPCHPRIQRLPGGFLTHTGAQLHIFPKEARETQSVLPGSSPPSSESASWPGPRLFRAPAGRRAGRRRAPSPRAQPHRRGAPYTRRPPGPRAHLEPLYTSWALAGGQGLRPRQPEQRTEPARLASLARPKLNL